jgi:hypothetical protein
MPSFLFSIPLVTMVFFKVYRYHTTFSNEMSKKGPHNLRKLHPLSNQTKSPPKTKAFQAVPHRLYSQEKEPHIQTLLGFPKDIRRQIKQSFKNDENKIRREN